MRAAGWLVLLSLLACFKPPPAPTPAPEPLPPGAATAAPRSGGPERGLPESGSDAGPPVPDAGAVSAPPRSDDPCGALLARVEAERNDAGLACTSAAECMCYSSLQFDNRLEVANKAAAARLQSLSREYHQRRCPSISVHVSTPPQCQLRCVEGQCR